MIVQTSNIETLYTVYTQLARTKALNNAVLQPFQKAIKNLSTSILMNKKPANKIPQALCFIFILKHLSTSFISILPLIYPINPCYY
jgi:hypothetical protein